jgi:hypothetical protein
MKKFGSTCKDMKAVALTTVRIIMTNKITSRPSPQLQPKKMTTMSNNFVSRKRRMTRRLQSLMKFRSRSSQI